MSGVKIPVVIAGGPKASSVLGVLRTIRDAILAGAKGVALGRNIFQHDNPEAMTSVVRETLEKVPADDEIEALVRERLGGEPRDSA